MNNLNGKTLKEFEAEQRRVQDSLQQLESKYLELIENKNIVNLIEL